MSTLSRPLPRPRPLSGPWLAAAGPPPTSCGPLTTPASTQSKGSSGIAPQQRLHPACQPPPHAPPPPWSLALTPYRLFPLQQQAFDYLDSYPTQAQRLQLRVFAQETHEDGRRAYLVTTPAKLWHVCRCTSPGARHWYEIIREGQPCHAYFDLEFNRGGGLNEGVDGEALMSDLLHGLEEVRGGRGRAAGQGGADLMSDLLRRLEEVRGGGGGWQARGAQP